MANEITISKAGARFSDSGALARLVERIPGGDEVLASLDPGCCGHLYDAETKRLYFLVSDSVAAFCITVAGASTADAAKMIAMFDTIEGGPVGMEAAAAIAAFAPGRNVSLVH